MLRRRPEVIRPLVRRMVGSPIDEVSSYGGQLAAVAWLLDLEPTEALRREGLVRELVHHVQNLRKSAGLHVSDRIVLGVETDQELAAALDEHRDHLAAEVLATEIRSNPVDGAPADAELSLDGHRVRLTLRPA